MTIDKLLTQGGLGFVYKKRAVSIAYKTLVKKSIGTIWVIGRCICGKRMRSL
jgi:hypothetical protein